MIKKEIQQVIVTGQGDSKESAFSDALGKIQKQVLKNTSDVMLRIEPKTVVVLLATEEKWTEKFLFFFMPRIKVRYKVKLQVEIEMSRIEMEKIAFKISDNNPEAKINIPFISKKI